MSRFNIGDRVKILCLDDISSTGMVNYVGQIGIIRTIDEEEENETSYGVSFESDYYKICWWFREPSLVFEEKNPLVNINEVFQIIINAREDYPEESDIFDEIICKIGELPCK
jgi:hypothetical protein